MKPVFADTFYFIALHNPNDADHGAAKEFAARTKAPIVTTFWVLIEVADALCMRADRRGVPDLIRSVKANPLVTVIPPSTDQFDRGLALFEARADKDWSLTDCISFDTMRSLGLEDALTGDHHFEQAGFTILFP